MKSSFIKLFCLLACVPVLSQCGVSGGPSLTTSTNQQAPASTIAKAAYVTSGTGSAVYKCSVDATTGVLSACVDASDDSVLTSAVDPQSVSIDSTGRYAYVVTGAGTNQFIYQCTINPTTYLFTSCSVTTVTSPVGFETYYGQGTLASDSLILTVDNSTSPGRIVSCPISGGVISANCADTGATGIQNYMTETVINQTTHKFYGAEYNTPGVSECNWNGSALSGCMIKTGDGTVTFGTVTGVAIGGASNQFIYVVDEGHNKIYACDATPTGSASFNHCTLANSGISSLWSIQINAAKTFAYISDYNTNVYTCPILTDGTFGTCVASTSVPEPIGIALHY